MRSYEFAQPRLEITSGTVEAGGRVHALAGGWLWCDRQVLTDSTTPPAQEIDRARPDRALAATTSALYRGCWLGLALDGGLCLALAVFWQPPAKNGDKQWVTGTLVGRPPRGGFGTAYFPLDGSFASRNGGRPLKGADLHGTHDFDLNILVPDEPEESPHWVSPVSYQTYATGWQLRFDPLLALELGLPETLYLRAMVDGCENLLGNAFWEGAANVYADVEGREEPIGRAFVEQMGFN
ncbi:MAG TPA: hypothetical protein VFX98_01845 [Longimicrobiaceae bacterium]|nr:hypothetical protein [Longimicrobiaceae bacterium]